MANRRMFSKNITESDDFLDLSHSAQTLYFHMAMNADDDGFINSMKKIQRMLGCADSDREELAENGFIIVFDNGVAVISHWKQHNRIQKDRYKPTIYRKELSRLVWTGDSEGYSLGGADDDEEGTDGSEEDPEEDETFNTFFNNLNTRNTYRRGISDTSNIPNTRTSNTPDFSDFFDAKLFNTSDNF